jgi:hypothetical protein
MLAARNAVVERFNLASGAILVQKVKSRGRKTCISNTRRERRAWLLRPGVRLGRNDGYHEFVESERIFIQRELDTSPGDGTVSPASQVARRSASRPLTTCWSVT